MSPTAELFVATRAHLPGKKKLFLKQSCLVWVVLAALSLVHGASGFAVNPVVLLGRETQTRSVSMAAKDVEMTDEEREVAMEKATKAMTFFTNSYLKNTGTKLCSDKSIPAVVIKGLAEHKVTLGAPLCPCRFDQRCLPPRHLGPDQGVG